MTTHREKKEFQQDDKTIKFVKQAKELIRSGKVKSYSDIAKDIEWPKTAVSDAINSRRNVPFDVLKKFTDFYNLGEKDWRDEKIEMLQEMNAMLKSQLETKKALERELVEVKEILSNLSKIVHQIPINKAYVKALWLVVLKHRIEVEKGDARMIQEDMDRLLAAELQEVS